MLGIYGEFNSQNKIKQKQTKLTKNLKHRGGGVGIRKERYLEIGKRETNKQTKYHKIPITRPVGTNLELVRRAGPSEEVRHGGGRRTKNLQGEREKGGKKEKRGERKERRKRKERARRAREKDVGLLHLYRFKTLI